MRIAICFYGLHPNKTNSKYSNKNIKNYVPYYLNKNLFNQYPNIDSFVHSWSIEEKDKIIEEFRPTSFEIEAQKEFDISNDILNIKNNNSNNKNCLKTYRFTWVEVMFSMFYSMKKVLNLMKDFENINNIKYDLVILSRMDIIFFKPLDLSRVKDLDAIYNSVWGENNYRTIVNNYKKVKGDLILGNSNNIYNLNTIFDDLPKYLKNFGEESSSHLFFKLKQDEITKNIKYLFNDYKNKPIEVERQRALTHAKVLPKKEKNKINRSLLLIKKASNNLSF